MVRHVLLRATVLTIILAHTSDTHSHLWGSSRDN